MHGPRPSQPAAASAAAGSSSSSANNNPGGGEADDFEDDDDDDDDDGKKPRPQPTLTLAQRMGLAEAPEPELTASEWEHIAGISRERDASRQPCVICCEPFKDERQVLLSCGHTFHRQCLRSWERHSKSRNCPVCRKQHYRKRGIDDGANLYREECTVQIQAAFRGALARRATAKALRHANPTRMRRYCEQRLSGLTDQLIGQIEAERSEVDDLFAEIDGAIAASRVLMGDSIDWEHAEEVARERGLADCPVCLAPLCAATGQGDATEPLALLSCTHVFHRRCLASFERFSITPACLCPVCRSAYSKQDMAVDVSSATLALPPVAAQAAAQPNACGGTADAVAADAAGNLCVECSEPCSSTARVSAAPRRRSGASASSLGRTAVTGRTVAGSGARAAAGNREARYEAIERLVAIGDQAAAAAAARRPGRGRGGGGGGVFGHVVR